MAYTHTDKCAKNCGKRTILFQVIVEDVVTFFWEHSVKCYYTTRQNWTKDV